MDNNQTLLDLIEHYNKKQIRASLNMTKYYEDEYGDDVELDYPNGAIGDPYGVELETISGIYATVVRELKERLNNDD
jgi:hypothetical protein